MVNHNVLKKELEEIILISTDFLSSNLAKELVLKDDEKTPKPINEKIGKELEEMLNVKSDHLNTIDLESLPSNIFGDDFKMVVMVSKTDIEETKKDITNYFNFSTFNLLEVKNNGKGYVLNYIVNKEYQNEVYIVFILAISVENTKNRKMFGDLKGRTPLPNGFIMDLDVSQPFTFEVITNTGVKFNLK